MSQLHCCSLHINHHNYLHSPVSRGTVFVRAIVFMNAVDSPTSFTHLWIHYVLSICLWRGADPRTWAKLRLPLSCSNVWRFQKAAKTAGKEEETALLKGSPFTKTQKSLIECFLKLLLFSLRYISVLSNSHSQRFFFCSGSCYTAP